jgi:hypothetical protein
MALYAIINRNTNLIDIQICKFRLRIYPSKRKTSVPVDHQPGPDAEPTAPGMKDDCILSVSCSRGGERRRCQYEPQVLVGQEVQGRSKTWLSSLHPQLRFPAASSSQPTTSRRFTHFNLPQTTSTYLPPSLCLRIFANFRHVSFEIVQRCAVDVPHMSHK